MNELPSGWVWTDTATVADVQGGIQKQPKRRPTTNHYPFLRVANVMRGRLDLENVHQIELFEGELDKFQLEVGDLLVVEGNGSPGQIGRAARWRGEISNCVHQNHLIRVRPTAAIDSQYLTHYWNASQTTQYLRSVASSTSGLYVLTTVKVRGVKIPLAPRTEQQRIVAAIEEAFSRIDAGLTGLQRVRRRLGLLRDSALKALSNSDDQWVKLGEIAEVIGGVTKDTKRQTDPSYVEMPYLRVANVQRGYLDLRTVTTIRVPPRTVEKLRLEPNDILFNEGGDRDKLGRGWVWEGAIPDCIHQNHVFRARLRTAEFDPKFVSMHGNTFGRTWFETMGKQTTNLASLSLTTLKAFPVPRIPIDEQRRLVAQIETQTSLIEDFERIVDMATGRAAALRSAILSWAFSGRLVPQGPNDEPASALLDRIASERASHHQATRALKTHTAHQEVTA